MSRRRRLALAALAGAVTLSSCGLPGDGTVRTVDPDDVPYGLLESEGAPIRTATDPRVRLDVPAVFWVGGEHLRPMPSGGTCAEDPEALLERLLDLLAAGPSDEARAEGRSSAVPTDSGLELAGLDDGLVTVDLQPQTSLSAEQLPIAVGQIVLTVATVPSVRSVLLTSDGELLQVPLPQGALTEGPVTARDYVELLPARLRGPSVIGCLRS